MTVDPISLPYLLVTYLRVMPNVLLKENINLVLKIGYLFFIAVYLCLFPSGLNFFSMHKKQA